MKHLLSRLLPAPSRAVSGAGLPHRLSKPESGFQKTSRKRRDGFTLIELIAVMGIIVALSLLVVGGYGGMSRAIASGRASRQVRDALLLARQTACVNGVRVYLYVLSEDEFVLCRKMGTSCGNAPLTRGQSGRDNDFRVEATHLFYDYYTDLGSFVNEVDRESERYAIENDSSSSGETKKTNYSSDMLIFDLSGSTQAKYATLCGVSANKDGGRGWSLYYKKKKNGGDPTSLFKEDADYGIALYPIRSLPKGYVFPEEQIGDFLYFDPTGKPGGPTREFVVAEAVLQGDADHRQTVKVDESGAVDVD